MSPLSYSGTTISTKTGNHIVCSDDHSSLVNAVILINLDDILLPQLESVTGHLPEEPAQSDAFMEKNYRLDHRL
ncbi:hypothetical protein Q1695_000923 [Nippostrongylus brasiliensis]|nr:hypothetical protein Q1695_000923 [Nippostrongylus brasiliensis]